MPNRLIKESICTSENLNSLSGDEEAFFYRLTVNCDDYGLMDARPSILRAKCFPLKIDMIKEEDIEAFLHALVKAELILVYEVEGKPYLKLLSWERHQQIRAKKSKYPSPDSCKAKLISNDIKRNQAQANVPVIQSNPNQSESKSKDMSAPVGADECEIAPAENPPSGGAQSKPGKGDYTDDFEEFWRNYPRRIVKKAAYRAWNTQLRKKVRPEDMIRASANYAACCQSNKTDTQFIKHPSSFLGPDNPFEEYVNGPPEACPAGKKVQSGFNAHKPANTGNFEQRKYDDDYFDGLYDNFKKPAVSG